MAGRKDTGKSLGEEYWKRHLKDMSASQRKVDAAFDEAVRKLVSICEGLTLAGGEGFTFSSAPPAVRKQAGKVLKTLASRLEAIVLNGIDAEWTLANNKNSELSRRVFGENAGRLSQRQYERYFTDNQPALDEFRKRKTGGLGISDRVWKYTDKFKEEIEMGLELGIGDRLSAADMASELKQYLRHPDKLFRRVRDEKGQLRLSNAAKAYHPGQGVYRSSYMNARRLAATETNIAYHTADYLRWQGMDFVVGIKVGLSNNHPVPDICDDLAGLYPKDFKFTGWHPHCRCHATTVMKTDSELAEDTRRIMRGEEPLPPSSSKNYVRSVPDGFSDWVKGNTERIEKAKSLPYFLSDNEKIMDVVLRRVPEGYSVVKEYGNGGRVLVHNLVNHEDSDYNKLVSIGEYFAANGKVARLAPKMTRPPKFRYESVYGDLVGTKYEGKCPDLKIDGLWYEHEGFVTENPKNAFRNMMHDGMIQSNRLIIDRPNLTERYMRRGIEGRIEKGEDIQEVWLRDKDGSMTLLYKNGRLTNGQPPQARNR